MKVQEKQDNIINIIKLEDFFHTIIKHITSWFTTDWDQNHSVREASHPSLEESGLIPRLRELSTKKTTNTN